MRRDFGYKKQFNFTSHNCLKVTEDTFGTSVDLFYSMHFLGVAFHMTDVVAESDCFLRSGQLKETHKNSTGVWNH